MMTSVKNEEYDDDNDSGSRLPHPKAVQGGQHSGRLLWRQVVMVLMVMTLSWLNYWILIKILTRIIPRTLEDFIKFLRPSEAAESGESEKATGEGEKVKKIEL